MSDIKRDPIGQKFYWVTNGEPHAIRRREILTKYGPQVRNLYGYDHRTAWQVLSVVLTQFIVAYLVKDWAWWKLWIVAYVISGTLNQNLFCAQHEISHCLAFRKPFHNRVLAIIGNLPLVVPVANKFREYHHDHHLFLGVDGGDVDLPTVLEAKWISSTLAKAIYGFFYLVVYGVRPLIVRPKPATFADAVNWVVVMACNGLVLWGWGFKSLIYLLAGSILGGGLHPLAGHLIAEHYMFEPGQETYSYYGPLNALSYNVGFHNEHHDFPQIPQTRLYRLKEIAPEYYEPLYQHMSWCWVIWKFLTDPTIGPWSRMHRETRAGTPEANAAFARGNCLKGILDEDVDVSMDRPIHSSTESAAEDSAGEESGAPTTRQKFVKTANRKHFRNDSAAESVPAK